MKKIFTLGLLLAPIMANADPVGPSAVGQGQTAVVATASAPYATATTAQGDTTNVVSASYVKGAYNDAIAAVNKVNNDKQAKLLNGSNNHNIESKVVAGSELRTFITDVLSHGMSDSGYNEFRSGLATGMGVQNIDDALISADIVLDAIRSIGSDKQERLINVTTDEDISNDIVTADYMEGMNHSVFENNGLANVNSEIIADIDDSPDNILMTSGGVLYLVNGAKEYTDSAISDKRVNALATWGSTTTTKVPLVNQ